MSRARFGKGPKVHFSVAGLLSILFLAACSANPSTSPGPGNEATREIEREFRIVTLLPRDAIPAIDNPVYYPAGEADAEYDPDELILGLSINGDARAYSIGVLSSHEIVNDTVGDQKISVTW